MLFNTLNISHESIQNDGLDGDPDDGLFDRLNCLRDINHQPNAVGYVARPVPSAPTTEVHVECIDGGETIDDVVESRVSRPNSPGDPSSSPQRMECDTDNHTDNNISTALPSKSKSQIEGELTEQ